MKTANGTRARVLIIEDEESIRQGFRAIFERDGYQVNVARDGKMAIRGFSQFAPDLAVVDILLPEKTGVETIKELLGLKPELKIIAVSGGGQHLQPEDCLSLAQKAGAHLAFRKPVMAQQLLDGAKELLEG